jgi:hypothetical protein
MNDSVLALRRDEGESTRISTTTMTTVCCPEGRIRGRVAGSYRHCGSLRGLRRAQELEYRTGASQFAAILMMEGAGIIPTRGKGRDTTIKATLPIDAGGLAKQLGATERGQRLRQLRRRHFRQHAHMAAQARD